MGGYFWGWVFINANPEVKTDFHYVGGGEGNEVLQEYTLLGQDTIDYYSPDDFIEVSLEYDRAKHKIMY